MPNSSETGRPVLVLCGPRVFIDVAADDAEELQVHLESHNIHTAWEQNRPGVVRLEILDLGADEVEAVLGEWEVPTA